MNGPVVGPIIGGFIYQSLGWRWNNWVVLIASGFFGALGLFNPETYAPILLRRRAAKLRKETGDERYMSRFCYKDGEGDVLELIKLNLKRPIIMLFTEPMWLVHRQGLSLGFAVLTEFCSIFWAIYIAAVYGILYLCFTAVSSPL